MTEDQARELLLERDALLEGHFRLSSGRHSSSYLQCAVALQYPRVAAALGSALGRRAQDGLGFTPDVVVSPALGGLIIGHEVGRQVERRACFTERVMARMTLRRGFALALGERVLLVEDVITTGLSSRETVAVIRQAGAVVVAAACIANRSGCDRLDDLPLYALLQLDVPTWEATRCPLCAQGGDPIKPGSRASS